VAGDVDVPGALLVAIDTLVLQAPEGGVLAPGATVLLPGRTALEKKGTWVNATGQRQLVKPALDPGRGVPEDWTLWRDLAGATWPTLKHLQAEMAKAGCAPATARKPSVVEKAMTQRASVLTGQP